MKDSWRREVYATTGTRITARVFAGWGFDEKEVVRPDFAAQGWLDSDGKLRERIYDVVCSDDRKAGQRRCERPVGDTVDVKQATYTNDIGDALLAGWWRDPDFSAEERAYTSPIWYSP